MIRSSSFLQWCTCKLKGDFHLLHTFLVFRKCLLQQAYYSKSITGVLQRIPQSTIQGQNKIGEIFGNGEISPFSEDLCFSLITIFQCDFSQDQANFMDKPRYQCVGDRLLYVVKTICSSLSQQLGRYSPLFLKFFSSNSSKKSPSLTTQRSP